jgi:phage-related protein
MQVFYHDEVKIFIKQLQKPTQSKTVRSIELVEHYGHFLGMPHVKKITRELFELRIRGRQEVRIFFVIQNNGALLLHGFVKKSQKTPGREIETAIKRIP